MIIVIPISRVGWNYLYSRTRFYVQLSHFHNLREDCPSWDRPLSLSIKEARSLDAPSLRGLMQASQGMQVTTLYLVALRGYLSVGCELKATSQSNVARAPYASKCWGNRVLKLRTIRYWYYGGGGRIGKSVCKRTPWPGWSKPCLLLLLHYFFASRALPQIYFHGLMQGRRFAKPWLLLIAFQSLWMSMHAM